MTKLKENEMKEHTNKGKRFSNEDDEKELPSDNTISKAKAEALKYLHQTHNKLTNFHRANVCVVCDCFINGAEAVKRLNKTRLSVHNKRLGVKNYKKFYKLKDIYPKISTTTTRSRDTHIYCSLQEQAQIRMVTRVV